MNADVLLSKRYNSGFVCVAQDVKASLWTRFTFKRALKQKRLF